MDINSQKLSSYQIGGALNFNHPTYITRDADKELYEALKRGEFCYILNARQTGKSSLKVKILHKLRKENIACADIDLTCCIEEKTSAEQFYRDFIVELINGLADSGVELDFERRRWWKEHEDLSPVHRLGTFVRQVLLQQISTPIVIFVDEIDYVLGLDFRSHFFALIRSFYNSRSTQTEYNRLTFTLLGVTTPSELIRDEKRTPFNIGKGIELRGFLLQEVTPLTEEFRGRVSHPEEVMKDILYWTKGQPYLTQKACDLVIKEGKANPDMAKLVQQYIINNWESQDEQQHLKTISNRLLGNEQKAGYLLELYRQILHQGEIEAIHSSEETTLRLSGLVAKRDGQLKVYNPIYEQIFNERWIDDELSKLRPYCETFRAWIASGCQDESRLLRGQALDEALGWASGKNLSNQDEEFLAASKKKAIDEEIAVAKLEAELEREKKEKQAAEKANQILNEAYQKAKRRIRWGLAGLAAISISAVIVMGFTYIKWSSTNKRLNQADKMLAEIYKQLESQGDIDTSPTILQIRVQFLEEQGSLQKKQGNTQGALATYKKAFLLLQSVPSKQLLNPDIQILSFSTIESVHRELIELLNSSPNPGLTTGEVEQSFSKLHYAQLEYLLAAKKWKEADLKTDTLMRDGFDCRKLKNINELWLKYSDKRFGYSVQRRIWESTRGNEPYIRFSYTVGWYNNPWFLTHNNLNFTDHAPEGHLPWSGWQLNNRVRDGFASFMLQLKKCNI